MNVSPEFQKLIDEKTEMEEELKQLSEKLKPFFEKKLHENLVDKDGFPRQDLDFAELSEFNNLKRKYAELNNDHKALMKKVESELFAFHAMAKKSGQADKEIQEIQEKRQEQMEQEEAQKKIEEVKIQEQQQQPQQQQIEHIQPFAQINEVTQGSPASTSGILLDDLIYDFGGVDINNHNNLTGLARKVTENIDKGIIVKLIRKPQQGEMIDFAELIDWNNQRQYVKKQLVLKPRKWEGNGVLGCRFKPL